ncbi:hypothetical protein KC19_VG099900 [Ceratodon purpureus]|uniref:SEC63 domain-containing protein n=1 Tax=Ceratodon purpureus TaxID=3225 RepID=A0A8T0HPC1_CERPU|nr:hypothetical protein KC19_VG099900 [Ceratodon purpureus]
MLSSVPNMDIDVLSSHLQANVESFSLFVVMGEFDSKLSPSNLKIIAAYSYISYTTIDRFSSSLIVKTTVKCVVETPSSDLEYARLRVRPGEDEVGRKLFLHQRFSMEKPGKPIQTVFDLFKTEDDQRRDLLQMTDAQLMDMLVLSIQLNTGCVGFNSTVLVYQQRSKEQYN